MLTLSLLRGPLYPDPLADEGEHSFTYSLFPHQGDWTEGSVVDEAFALNSPLIAVPAGSGTHDAGMDHLLLVEGLPLTIGSLKRAEDGEGMILRLYEPHGNRGRATLRISRPVERIERVDLLEESTGDGVSLLEQGRATELDVRPFEVISLRVVLYTEDVNR
jgi:alpha-mannosidase